MAQKRKIDLDSKRKSQRLVAKRVHENSEDLKKLPETAPRHLDRIASRMWTQLVPVLNKTGITTIQDKAVVESFCMSYSMLRNAWGSIQEHGQTYESESGRIYKNPAVDILSDSQNKIKQLGGSIGLTPESRAAFVDLGKSDGSEDLDKILSKFG